MWPACIISITFTKFIKVHISPGLGTALMYKPEHVFLSKLVSYTYSQCIVPASSAQRGAIWRNSQAAHSIVMPIKNSSSSAL